MPEIISRKDALEQGLQRYFTGKPCIRGGVGERLVGSRACVCIECVELRRERVRKRRADNPEKERAQKRNLRAANPEKARERDRKWYAANPDKTRESGRKYHAANPGKRAASGRRWYAENIVRAQERGRENMHLARSVLSNSHVANRLGFPVADAPPELMEQERERIFLMRASRELNKVLKELNHVK